MTSKITEAIEQLNKDVTSLYDAMPSMQEAADEKAKQVKTLREEYFVAQPEILSGVWEFDMSLSDLHARLTGWKYDKLGSGEGDDSGNFLVAGIALTDDENITIEFPYSTEKPLTCVRPRVQLTAGFGEIRIDFYNIESSEVFRFIKEHNIMVEISDIDKHISGFKERINKLTITKQAIIDAGVLKSEPEQMFVDCTAKGLLPRVKC